MIAYVEVPPIVDTLERELQLLSEQLLSCFSLPEESIKIDTGTNLFSMTEDAYIYLQKGVFKYYHQNKLIRLYAKGDFLYIPKLPADHGCRCISEFGADIFIFSFQELKKTITADREKYALLFRYQALQSTVMHVLCAAYSPDDVRPDITIHKFESGDVIIAEGDPAREIYQMMQGRATVTVKGTAVGVVEEGEVFGEISFFTENARTATVTATSECLVQIMRKNDFIAMIKLKPSVNLAISKTLSQRLVQTNKKITGES